MLKFLKLILIVTIACVVLFFLGHLLEHSSTHGLSQIIIQHHWAFTLWRYGLYILVLAIWPHFIGFVGKRQNWGSETIVYVSNQRVKLLTLFLIIEVFFVYNLLGHVLAWL